MGNSTGRNGRVKMDDEKISLRISSKELQELDAYLSEHPELGSRSLFIRTAVREYINRDADVPRQTSDNGNTKITVEVTEYQMMVIDSLVGVYAKDRADIFEKLLKDKIDNGRLAGGAYKNAFDRLVATAEIPM